MNRVSKHLLKISFKMEEMGHSDFASELASLADSIADDDRLLTVEEARVWLGCGRSTLDQMVNDRRIPAHLIGGRYRFDKSEVLRETKLSG